MSQGTETFVRASDRAPDKLRPTRITREYISHAEGSCLIEAGQTRVICTASVEPGVPRWLAGQGRGWITAEYAMLPRATAKRTWRERNRSSSRSLEIQRMIGRALRAVTDLESLGEQTIWIDCDVIEADGGTRCAAVTGGMVALYDALRVLQAADQLEVFPVQELVASVSVGMVRGFPLLDLTYEEDSAAEVDLNVVMGESGRLVEIQGTAELCPFSREDLDTFLDLGKQGIEELFRIQREALGLEG